MAQARIKRITPANPPTWTGQHGTMYAFDVELDDGTTGVVNAKSENKWHENDQVEYTAQSTHHGVKLKLDKPGFSNRNGQGSQKYTEDDTKGIIASWAVECAMRALDVNAGNYEDQVIQYARLALQARARIKEEVVV